MMTERLLFTASAEPDRILVVDDELQIRALIERLLRRAGYRVDAAADGLQAISRLRHVAESGEEAYALVVSDLRMPGADGLHVLREVSERSPGTMFVLITGYASLSSAIAALREGAYDYLTKPIDLDDLRSTVRRALDHRALVRQNERLIVTLQRTARSLRQVNAIARQITTLLDEETLIATVLDLIAPAFDLVQPSFGLVREGELLFTGGVLDGRREALATSLCWALTKQGRVPYVRALASQGPPPCDQAFDLVFPLQAGNQAVGLWVAGWRAPPESQAEQLPYLEALAAQTVAVLENARLYALARKANELSFLNGVGHAANCSLDLEETIRSVLGHVQRAFDASLVEVYLFDARGEIESVYALAPGLDGGCLCRPSSPLLGVELVRRVGAEPLVTHQEMVVVDAQALDIAGRPIPGGGDLPAMRSVVGVALPYGERRVGALGVGSERAEAYDLESARLLQIVGGQVASAIENARLFREVESGRRAILNGRNTLQALFDGILDGIYIVDRENRILAINRTQATWAGRDVRELIGMPARCALPGSEESLALIAETFRMGQPLFGSERWRTERDRWTEWEIHTYPISSSQVERVVVVVRDVTEQCWLETSLARSEKLAAVGTLAAGIAHEINNPMTVVSANAQILREEIPSTHPYYGSVQLIARASERASKIVRNLLDFSRAEQFEFKPTDLARSIRESVSLVEPQLLKSDIQIVVDVDPELPAISASPDHLNVVWLNLLLNARDAIQETGRGGEIRIDARRHGDWVVVQVSDNGVGMTEEQLGHLYEPFYTTREPGEGTGLGLFTCYRTVTRHGGDIAVESQEGQGTTFRVTLPIDRL